MRLTRHRKPSAPRTAPGAAPRAAHAQGILFCSGDEDRIIEDPAELRSMQPSHDQLLWIDLLDPPAATVAEFAQSLALPAELAGQWGSHALQPALHNFGDAFWVRVVVARSQDSARFDGVALSIVAGRNMVVTLHDAPIEFIEHLRARELGQTELGRLTAASFTASLLDWQLSTYFDAVSRFEIAIEKIEITILSQQPRDCLDDLRALRQAASRLRRMLAPHRAVFGALARPDFRPQEDPAVCEHFLSLDARFERTIDYVESARELVAGSFELFSGRTALRINDSMRVLTWATVVLGVIGVVLAFFQ